MTDPREPDDTRAERAFRDAFTEHADALEPAVLAPRTSRRRWPVLVAGAAALAVVAVTATFAVINADDGKGSPEPSAATATDQTETPSAPGTRVVSYRGVAVDVPEGWIDDYIPSPSGCDYPTEPFVAVEKPGTGYTDMRCASGEPAPPEGFPAVVRADWVPSVQVSSLSMAAESLPDGETTDGEWTLTRATVAGVRIEVLTDTATHSLAAQIVQSARTVVVDQSGCDATSPAQAAEFVRPPAFDLAEVGSVDSIAVCQYVRGDLDAPGLIASAVIAGEDAQAELEALQAAPVGGVPDVPGDCSSDTFGDQALVVELRADEPLGEIYVYYDNCFGNGFDDGTTRRALTEENCSPLFVAPVQPSMMFRPVAARCHPHGS